ncbi:MAG TPA: hypothetical protein VJW23_19925 [Propionibacteriaceae bacterium]|nr:hypothetical protein [Propionibacteriaceae bacterium]
MTNTETTAQALARTMASKSDDELTAIVRLTGLTNSAKMAAKREQNARRAARQLVAEGI